MNKVILTGRLTKDPTVNSTSSSKSVCNFTVANNDNKTATAFVNCVAWENNADFLAKYFKKGDGIVVIGRLNPRDYEDASGKKVHTVEVVVENIEFPIQNTSVNA